MYMCFSFFFFKQKTAYEMRISDWSSDVCSSDLIEPQAIEIIAQIIMGMDVPFGPPAVVAVQRMDRAVQPAPRPPRAPGIAQRLAIAHEQEIGRASCRGRVWQYV